MNYKAVLEYLGLVENLDFTLTVGSFEMLEKFREVIQETVIPAVDPVLDENGEVVTAGTPEYIQYLPVQEGYFPEPPTQEQLDNAEAEVLLLGVDIYLVISEYLLGKELLRDSGDTLNVVDNKIFSWDFKNIPMPTRIELAQLVAPMNVKIANALRKKELLEAGKKAREVCTQCLDTIAGFNLSRLLTAEQISLMQSTFAQIQMALMTSRPSTAKFLISAMVVDEVLVTQEMKDDVLELLQEY